MNNLFLVAKVIAETEKGRVWEFVGVFDSRGLAEENCRDWRYSIQPVTVNKSAPD